MMQHAFIAFKTQGRVTDLRHLIDQIPEGKMAYIIAYLQGAALPDEMPNAETRAAIAEVDAMVNSGAGQHFAGNTADFLAQMLEG